MVARSQWLLTRIAESERRNLRRNLGRRNNFRLLSYVFKQRAQLERSFRTAIADMKQAQKERQARARANATKCDTRR